MEKQDDLESAVDASNKQEATDKPAESNETGIVISSDTKSTEDGSTSQKENDQPAAVTEVPKKKRFRISFKPERMFPGFIRRKLGKYARATAIIIILLVISGGTAAAFYAMAPQKTTPPRKVFAHAAVPFQIIQTSPGDNASDVDVQTKIKIDFNRPVTPSRLENEFFASPTLTGTFTAGATNKEVVFTPNVPIQEGSVIKIMVHGEFQSNDGSKLGGDYSFSYATTIPSYGVLFQKDDGYSIAKLASGKTGTVQHFKLQVGKDVNPKGTITVYKASLQNVLQSLTYHDVTTAEGGYTYPDFIDKTVGTDGLTQVSSHAGLKDGASFDINQKTGIYLVAATSNGKQSGWMWVVFNDNGLMVRQDSRKLVLAMQGLDNSAVTSEAAITVYNLKDSIRTLKQDSVTGVKEIPIDYEGSTDLVVATIGDDTMITPVSILESLADVRSDLGKSVHSIYGLTDRPTYQAGDTVKYAGFIRLDNDAQYQLAGESSVDLFVADPTNPDKHLADITADISGGGVFSGSFSLGNSYSPDKQNHEFALYAYDDRSHTNRIAVSTFIVSGKQLPQYNFNVKFDKKEYLANQTVLGQVTATTADGKPLANTTATYNIYSKDYYENDPSGNLASLGYEGAGVGAQDATLNLDANGHASIPIDLTQLQSGSSHVVTVRVSKKDANDLTGSGGASAVIHQGDAKVQFGTGRTEFNKGEELFSRVYVSTLDGTPYANGTLNYRFATSSYNSSTQKYDEKVVATGSTQTDSSGYAAIHQSVDAGDIGYVSLIVTAKDENGLAVEARTGLTILQGTGPIVHSDLVLSGLDVSGSSGITTVGDTLSLTITAPQDMTVLATQQRGLIYKYELLTLKQGANNYQIDVTPALAPSFTLSLSYFRNSEYRDEGTSFTVNAPQQRAALSVTADKQQYAANDAAELTISAKGHDGSSLATNLIVGIVSDSAYSLSDIVAPDMYTSLYGFRELTTSSSSSLVGIGFGGGGKCGGSGDNTVQLANRTGRLLYWNAALVTGTDGQSKVRVTLPAGAWRVYVYSESNDSAVGSAEATITSQ
jgi:uncharacterized protein YfaS (alpha-2-macroglobulin family)